MQMVFDNWENGWYLDKLKDIKIIIIILRKLKL